MTRTHSHIRPGIAVSVQINNSLCFYFTSQPGQAVFTCPPSPCQHCLLLLLLWAHTHSQGRREGGSQIFTPKSGQRTVPKHTCPPCTLESSRFGIPIAVAESQSQPHSQSESEFEVRGSLSLFLSLCCNYRWAHVA